MNDKRLTTEEIEENFKEIAPAMTKAEAKFEANRCLYCYDAPCTRACPTHIDVPSFIKKIASDNLHGSARVIFDANPIGSSRPDVDVLLSERFEVHRRRADHAPIASRRRRRRGRCYSNPPPTSPAGTARTLRLVDDHVTARRDPATSRAG